MTRNNQSIRWVMIGLGFTVTVINYLDRQTLAVAAPLLIDRYRMSAVTYSWIVAAFMLAYTVMNPVWGRVLDRPRHARGLRPRNRCVVGCRGGTSVYLGAGIAGNLPVPAGRRRGWELAGRKLAAEWFNAKERALATGIFNSGSAFGSVLAAPVIVWIVLKFGWRAAFAVVGATGFVWLIGWMWIYYTPASAVAPRAIRRMAPWRLVKIRFVWSFTLSKVFMDPAWYFYVFWFPSISGGCVTSTWPQSVNMPGFHFWPAELATSWLAGSAAPS